jgi:hypothetical protein
VVEYAWNMGFCDPCAAEPLSIPEQAELGARWAGRGQPAYLTRLHVRYDAHSFPEDIAFEETEDTGSFQARYVLRHPWRGAAKCEAATTYRAELPKAFAEQARTLADLTGWSETAIAARMRETGQAF